jgi:transposase
MNETLPATGNLPGLTIETSSRPAAPPPATAASPRLKPIDRQQLVWRVVDLEHLIEEDHPARAIWELTGQLDLQAFYAPISAVSGVAGRPSWDPRLLISLWIYAYSRGINSAREVADRCTYDPGFEWLCGLEAINYHTISDFRVAHGAALQELFVELLGVLSAEGLVSLERVMHDGTKIKACASGDSFRREPSLQRCLEEARQQVAQLNQETPEAPTRQQAAQRRAARERQQRVQQALEQLEVIRQSKDTEAEAQAARASLSDPEARVMKQPDGGYAPSYNAQLSTEASHKIIVGVEVSQNGSDGGQLMDGVKRVEANFQAPPKQVVADGGFTSRETIQTMADQGIDFIGSLGDQPAKGAGNAQRHGIAPEFAASAFEYDATHDRYRCPAGQLLPRVGQSTSRPGGVQYKYQAAPGVCASCIHKGQCCPKTGPAGRSVSRWVDAPAVRQFREKMQGAEAKAIYRQRAPVAEFPNAWIKDKLNLRQFRLRGLVKVRWETLWACLTYNIQQWIRLSWRPKLAVG